MAMPWALATAAGKDATLALHRARAEGLEVRWALNIFEGNTGLVRFHGTPRALVEAQARALGLEPVFGETHPASFEEVLGTLLEDLRERGARGVIFGNLHLEEIRAWYEARVHGAGLLHREPLWGIPPREVVEEVVGLGFRATVTAVNLELGDPAWLGRELDPELLAGFLTREGMDPAGERGEYHTFVHHGPGFQAPVPFRVRGEAEREGHRFLALEPGPE
jgi:uncharacterized protein (TIGR00290 family)